MDTPILRLDRYIPPQPHILPLGPRISLEITRGRVQQRVRPVQRRVYLIGAATDCDLVLGDASFPEAYAYLFVHDAKITIRRLNAGPELVVCEESVETAELHDGDRLAFGPFELRIRVENSRQQRRASEANDEARSAAWSHLPAGWCETDSECGRPIF